ncbi:tetratricopeptide repeat protein [uncultured Phocaeicola sp.]|uniref:tetratricopeptide repeat protein n=1 Tax=uncultured Phocaeicola sp. TaxID=990718 RepID=UPI0025D3C6DF|nr:tetratricopeptide repeat protein [uncultured Phocaeicola sp.]
MDEKNKLSEEVRKQFNELLRNKKFNEAINLIEPFANSGCLDAAYCLCFMLTGLSKHPDGVAAHIHLVLDKLLHADWFLSLLDYETEREKKEGYTGKNAIKLLNDLAEKGNQDALNKLTEIGMQLGGLVAGWAGDIHYALQEYDIALRCYRLGKDKHGLARMYERGEGVSLDAEKAFHYYVEAEDYYNMGRMYEQGIGTKQDLQKAFECYHKIIHEECWNHASDEWNEQVLVTRRSFRRLKKLLFEQKDEIRMTVTAKESESVCGFSFISYGDCLFTIDWGDGQVEEINNEKGEEIHAEHTYVKKGEWHICLKSDETHTLTSFHYTCEACTLKALNVTQCPVLIDLYCVNQKLKSLNVSKNPRLQRLVCRGNKLETLNIRKNNRLIQLDCSDNPLNYLNWHPRYSALLRVCTRNTTLFPDQYDFLDYLLKRNDGREVNAISEDSFEKLHLNLSYYMRCSNWKDIKEEVKNGVTSGKIHTWEKYHQAFAKICSMEVDKTNTNGKWKIVSDGWVHGEYNLGNGDYSPQDIEDVHMSWSEWLATPVEAVEKEGWMMLPLTKPSEIAGQCFLGMTYENKWCDINLLRSRSFNL